MFTGSGKNLIENHRIVELVRGTFTRASSGLENFPGLLKRVLKEDMWRERVVERTGEVVTFDSFQAFVEAPPLEGLGTTIENLLNLCQHDPELVSLIHQATQRTPAEGDRDRSMIPPDALQELAGYMKDSVMKAAWEFFTEHEGHDVTWTKNSSPPQVPWSADCRTCGVRITFAAMVHKGQPH